ncbi:MAG: GDSL-type esterase/lipase family protein [Ilumatobacteraceae bacterium]|nr:GDSL-type esterase/lipase family protein [Ilumatobacteraceae bacterium]
MSTFSRRTFLALGVVVAAGCTSTRSGTGSNAAPLLPAPGGTIAAGREAITSVAMVGDSITEGSVQALTTTLTNAGVADLRIEGERSRRIEVGNGKGDAPLSGVITTYNLLAEGVNPDAWVIELGTNDVGSYSGADAYGALIDLILGMLPEQRLVWVNTYRKQYFDDTVLFNTVLEQRLTDRGNAVIADWFSIASAPRQTVLQSDNLHPNDNGQLALSLLVLQGLQQL